MDNQIFHMGDVKKGRASIRPLPYVGHNSDFIYLRNGRKVVEVPLRTPGGFLQGVARTPNGEILEFRHVPERAIAETRPKNLRWFSQQHINVYTHGTDVRAGPFRADATVHLGHVLVDSDIQGKGVGTKVFELAENAAASQLHKRRGKFKAVILREETARALHKRGWQVVNANDAAKLSRIATTKTNHATLLNMQKFVEAPKYGDPSRWHRLEVLGHLNKPIVLPIRIKRSRDELLAIRRLKDAERSAKHRQRHAR